MAMVLVLCYGAGDGYGDVVGDGAGDGDVVGDGYGASAVLWCW